MKRRSLLAAALAVCAPSFAQTRASAQSCAHQTERELDFRAPASRDRLIVTIGQGPCSRATLRLEIRTRSGRLLYRFENRVEHLVLPDDQGGSLADEARRVAAALGEQGMTEPDARLPLEDIRSGPAADLYTLAVTEDDYRAHLRSRRRVFAHATYYEGGVAVVFDPASGRARVLYRWGA